jgi:hypothetical protein
MKLFKSSHKQSLIDSTHNQQDPQDSSDNEAANPYLAKKLKNDNFTKIDDKLPKGVPGR